MTLRDQIISLLADAFILRQSGVLLPTIEDYETVADALMALEATEEPT